jgi:hypothetical protein
LGPSLTPIVLGQDLVPLSDAEHNCDMPAKGGRASVFTQRSQTPNPRLRVTVFALSKTGDLEMKSAHYPFACRQGGNFPKKVNVNSVLLERASLINLGEEAALVDAANGPPYLYIANSNFRNFNVPNVRSVGTAIHLHRLAEERKHVNWRALPPFPGAR